VEFFNQKKIVPRLQLAGAAEGCQREGDEDEADDDGQGDEPVGGVARPGTEGGVKPAEGEYGKCGANHFVKELFENAPETAEATRSDGLCAATSHNC